MHFHNVLSMKFMVFLICSLQSQSWRNAVEQESTKAWANSRPLFSMLLKKM